MADLAAKAEKALKDLGIQFSTIDHPAVMTAEAQVEHAGHLPGALCKNLFYKDKKAGLFLVTTTVERRLNTKALGNMTNPKATNLRQADASVLEETLGVKPGCVTPLAVMNDTEAKVTLIIDKELMGKEYINCHPLVNTKTTAIKPDDLIKFVSHYKHDAMVLDLGSDTVAAPAGGSGEKEKPKEQPKKEQPKKEQPKKEQPKKGEKQKKEQPKKEDGKKDTGLGLQFKKDEDFAQWYPEVITKAEMIDYYDISGCYILRPWSFAIWESIQAFLDSLIKSVGVQGCYFPLFVSERALTAEKDHVEGFAPEVAWVTKSGDGDLAEPIAVRPTSETIMYPAYAKWIHSHRDLPLKLNQWSNVVRWEFKYPTPFIRSREFLWQEGHTAFATKAEADEEVQVILDFYRRVYEELLCVPVIKGKKTEKEKFAGGDYTTTVEAFIPNVGRGIQGATSHCLGQNFGKMFHIEFEDEDGKKQIPWQNSWGLTTRTIGVMVMTHGDDMGLVLPPRVAPVQVVIVPIIFAKTTSVDEQIEMCERIAAELVAAGVRVEVDKRLNYTAGWKFNHWEQKGVPLRVELGPKDMEKNQVVLRRRDRLSEPDGKMEVPLSVLTQQVALSLVTMQHDLLAKATQIRDDRIIKIWEWKDFVPALNKNCMVLTPFCDEEEEEDAVKDRSKAEALAAKGDEAEDERTSTSAAAKTLCIPYDQPELPEGTKCFATGKPAKCWVLWGRSY